MRLSLKQRGQSAALFRFFHEISNGTGIISSAPLKSLFFPDLRRVSFINPFLFLKKQAKYSFVFGFSRINQDFLKEDYREVS